ncbi:MAG: response regulator [Gammaproteobacteria bacterium]|nr:response regulator [Gammaproteobacteria bacterium]MDJ0871185.1 response regulator [Gammaproteobacteria bacterium]
MSTEATVFVVDDDDAVRRAVDLLLESVGLHSSTYASAEAFLADYDPASPGCLVLDVRMPGTSGLALQEILVSRGVEIPIIFITGHGDVATAVRAMKAHAFDFLEKPFNDQELLDRIHEAILHDARNRGERASSAEIAQRMAKLTRREGQIMAMIVEGKSGKVIASALDISEKTVQTHRARVMEKMRASSVAELVRMTARVG